MKNEQWGCGTIHPKACMKCKFAHGEPPFANLPEKAYCMIYERGKGNGKPPEVYFQGAECEFFEEE